MTVLILQEKSEYGNYNNIINNDFAKKSEIRTTGTSINIKIGEHNENSAGALEWRKK